MKDIDFAALDCLAALADAGHFDGAAERLAITQSAVSQRLRALEAQAGRLLVVRSRPLRLTEAGKLLLRHARQWQAMRADLVRELGADAVDERLPIAVNADSLATWVLPALDALVRDGLPLELLVDDQEFTHDALREGAVLGCVSTVARPLRGCRIVPLGVMRYGAFASPGFIERHLGISGRDAVDVDGTVALRLPFVVFDRRDRIQHRWAEQAYGVRAPRLIERFVPSSEAYVQATRLGWGIGVLPAQQSQGPLEAGELVALRPQATVEVALYWHQWQLGASAGQGPATGEAGGGSEATRPPVPPRGALDRVGAALQAGAARALAAMPAEAVSGRRSRRA